MNVLLTGASGFIGQHISKILHAAGHQIKEVSRRNGHDFRQLITSEDWMPLLEDIEIVINCVGIIAETGNQTFTTLHYRAPIALFKACAETRITKVIQISALGADERAYTPYQISKRDADNMLRSLPLNWFILRPSLVYGRGGKSMQMFQKIASLPLLALIDGGEQVIQPVYIDDLTEAVLHCIRGSKSNLTIDVVGAHAILFREWLQLMRTTKGKTRASVISVPFKLSVVLARFAKYIFPLMHPDNLRMLQKGNVADVKPFADFIGHMPLDVKTGLNRL